MLSHSLADTVPVSSDGRNPQGFRENGERPASTQLATPPNTSNSHSARNLSLSVTVLTDPAELQGHFEELNELSRSSSEPNVFYEPWMLLPSLRAFGKNTSFVFVLVFGKQAGKHPLLCGFFPLYIADHYRGIPVHVARLWTYLHFYWAAPLIREGYEHNCLRALFEWLQSSENRCSLIEFGSLPAEGPLGRALVDEINELDLPRYISELYTRALLRRAPDAESCIRKALPGRRLKELGRVRRRLAERGTLNFEELTPDGKVAEWIEGFLALEASGWKGEAGTALASTNEKQQFFTDSAHAAFARGQLMMMRLCLDGRPIAYKCNFLSAPGSFAFKIAYDERYSGYSPGVHLELENIRRFHAMCGLEWMDSCADAGHFMANHLWSDSRAIQTTVVAIRGRLSGLLLALLPFLKWTKHSIRRAAPAARNNETINETRDNV